MWLLTTNRAELQFFVSSDAVPGRYAILSHRWGPKEESFQDLQAIHKQCEATGENPRDLVSPKIRNSCVLAEEHGYQWVWIDTCCIDKTSSAEISEAINSMFNYYTLSGICYVYLEDVPSKCILTEPGSPFRRSKWHTRGWTLQELIAPRLVLFVSKSWDPLGFKSELASLLEEITHVPVAILRQERMLSRFSIAQRMSWAATRETTRLEDEAYCLLGLFNINMPTLYGEGIKADRKSTRLNSSHSGESRMPSSA